MTTINEIERQKEHELALVELKRQRGVAAAKLAELDAKLAQCEDGDFKARLGSTPVSSMSVKEKVEVVNRIGFGGFRDLVLGRR